VWMCLPILLKCVKTISWNRKRPCRKAITTYFFIIVLLVFCIFFFFFFYWILYPCKNNTHSFMKYTTFGAVRWLFIFSDFNNL
jgi:hypothetical protein